MTFIRKLLFLLPIVFLFACSSEDDSPIEENNDPQILRLIHVGYEGTNDDSYTRTITYNTNGNVAHINSSIPNSGEDDDYIYANNRLTKILRGGLVYFEMVYDNDRLIQILKPNHEVIYDITSDNQGRTIELKSSDIDGQLICSQQYSYSGTEINYENQVITCQFTTYDYTYDTKTNPNWGVYPPAYRDGLAIPRNNWLTTLVSETGSDPQLQTHTYTYNNDDYPIKEVISVNGTVIGTYNYTYE